MSRRPSKENAPHKLANEHAMGVVLFLSALSWAADEPNASPAYFEYEDLLSHHYYTLIDIERSSVYFVDFGKPATFCPADSDYYCVDSPDFHFAIPKRTPTEASTWDVNGHKYTAKQISHSRWLLGRKSCVIVVESSIATQAESQVVTYYYSPEFGLLGYETNGRTPARNLLSGTVGFGAMGTNAEACSSVPIRIP